VRPSAIAACPAPSSAAGARNIGWGSSTRDFPGSIGGRAEATYARVLRQRDANGLRNHETNRRRTLVYLGAAVLTAGVLALGIGALTS
jgi:hypothetical protein